MLLAAAEVRVVLMDHRTFTFSSYGKNGGKRSKQNVETCAVGGESLHDQTLEVVVVGVPCCVPGGRFRLAQTSDCRHAVCTRCAAIEVGLVCAAACPECDWC